MMRWLDRCPGHLAVLVAITAGCGEVPSTQRPIDAAVDSALDGPPPALGTKDNPAHSCAELKVASMASGVYWLRHPDGKSMPLQVYCEQQINGGGWVMMENSVRRDDGATTAFWQFKYADRFQQIGTLAADQNYYNGGLYLLGTEYMDVFVDLQDRTAVAAVMTATGINQTTMHFLDPALTVGNSLVYTSQFASGWSSLDHDDDTNPDNCAVFYSNVAQHYGSCWVYNLGADADMPFADGGVGPHASNTILTALGLALQPGTGTYSQLKRIARFTRW